MLSRQPGLCASERAGGVFAQKFQRAAINVHHRK
jgi:hypothetical protein